MIKIIISSFFIFFMRVKSYLVRTGTTSQGKSLIICRGGVGDVIITVRVLLNANLSEFDLLTNKPSGVWVQETYGRVFNKIFITKEEFLSESRCYDTIHLIRSDIESLKMMLALKISFRSTVINEHYDSLRLYERTKILLFPKVKRNYYSNFHATDLYSTVLRMPQYKSNAIRIKKDNVARKIGIHAGASNIVRAISLQAIIEVITSHPEYIFYLFGSKSEVIQYPKDMLPSGNVRYLIGEASFSDIALIMNELDLMVCTDSMFLHYADFMQIPTVAVMGPGPIKMWGPLYIGSKVVTRDPPCSPCSRVECDRYHGRSCVGDVRGEELSQAMLEVLEKN
jgi:ADP-heptose:LPS heptosyltransferase